MSGAARRSEARTATAPAGRRTRTALRVPRWLGLLHRWLGIGMCLFFAMWFASGITMMFVPYPSLDAAARYHGQAPLDMQAVRLAPEDALGRLGLEGRALDRFALLQRVGSETSAAGPVYVAWPRGKAARMLDAATGAVLGPLGPEGARLQAERFGGAAARAVRGPYRDDQWTVAQGFNPYRPLWRVDLADDAGTELYVSAMSGEIVQATTRVQRIANYAGSVVHWIYPTLLRRYPAAWSNTVWCISGIGILLALSGMVLGVLRSTIALRNARRPQISPFRKVFRLHHLLGLFAGLFLITWITSGWLSVDHGLIFPTGMPNDPEARAYQGRPVADAARDVTLAALHRISGPSMVNFNVVGGELVIAGVDGRAVKTTWSVVGDRLDFVPDATLSHAVATAWPAARNATVEMIASDDSYGHLIYQGLPEGAVRVRLGDDRGSFGASWVDVDRASGALIDVVDWRRRLYRWLFNGLHTFDVPGLSQHSVLRRLVMMPILLAGLSLSVTGALLGLKRLCPKRRNA